MSSRVLRTVMVLAALVPGAAASAQPRTSYDLERLQLDPSARGSLVLGDGETLPRGGLRLAVGVGWERSPLVLTAPGLRGRGLFAGEHRIGTLVRDRWTLHTTLGLGITDRLEAGIRVPATVSQRGSDLGAEGLPALRGTGLGPFSAMLRYGVTRQGDSMPVSTALAAEVGFPISRSGDVNGDPKVFLTPRVEVGRRYDRLVVGADLAATLRTRGTVLPAGEALHDEILAGVLVATTGHPLRYEATLRGAFNADGLGVHGELLGGIRWRASRYGELFALAGPGLGSSPGTPTFRALVGLALFTPEPEAAAAPPPPPPVAEAPPPDPCAPGQAHTPEQCPDLDDDGDGIPNGQDRCPLVKGIPELQGCPAVDSDGDGIPDHLDKCPSEPGVAEYQGCPPPLASIKAGKIDIKERVFFDTGKSAIQPRSYALLDDVARLISANPQVGRIRVEGHTDDRGPAALNRKLSTDRAEAVKAYLVSKGVDAGRLEAVGYGPDRPATSNATAAGREANRRVEFTIVGKDES